MSRLFAGDAHRVEGIVHCPFALERLKGPVPYPALRMPLAHRHQLPLEIVLADLEGRLQVDVVGGNGVSIIPPFLLPRHPSRRQLLPLKLFPLKLFQFLQQPIQLS